MDVIIVLYANAILCIKFAVLQATAGSKGPGPSKAATETMMHNNDSGEQGNEKLVVWT